MAHVGRAEWNEAGALGAESLQLAQELLSALLPLGRHRLTTHLAAFVTATVPAGALAHLVQRELDEGHVASAAALARGMGLLERFDLVEHVLRCYEAGRPQEAADAIGGDKQLELRTLSSMVRGSRGLPFALQYAPALRHLSTPDAEALSKLGAQARAVATSLPAASSGGGSASSLAEAVRECLESALRARAWPDARVHIFGSAALGLASATSDVDVCALLPALPHAHCRDAAGRAKLAPVLATAAEALRGCAEVSGVVIVREGRTPLIRLEFDAASGESAKVTDGACTSVELCFNNTDGLANTYVMRELLATPLGGVESPLRALAAVARHWARQRGLCGTHNTLNAYSWSLLAAYTLQQLSREMPVVGASSGAFAALIKDSVDGTMPEAWRNLARASLASNSGGNGVDEAMRTARMLASDQSDASVAPEHAHALPPPSTPVVGATADAALGLLVWHFFGLWAFEFPYRRRVVSLREPHELSKPSKGWLRRDEQALMLEDPIEIGRDLGRLVGRAPLHAMRLDAALALVTIAGGGSLDEVCVVSDWKLREHVDILGASRLSELQLPPARPSVLVTTLAQCEATLPTLRRSASLGVDCEGEQLSRAGRLCLLQISGEDGSLYLFDVLAPDGGAIVRALAPLLESLDVLKVLHDCRRDAEALLHQHGVRLANVFDTQAAYAALRQRSTALRTATKAARPSRHPAKLRDAASGGTDVTGIAGAAQPSLPEDQAMPSTHAAGEADAEVWPSLDAAPNAPLPPRPSESKRRARVHKAARTRTECAPLAHLVRRFLGGGSAAKESIATQMSTDGHYWARRPLTASQRRYAASDVAVLLPLHRRLLLEIELIETLAGRHAATTAAAAASSQTINDGQELLSEVRHRSSALLSVRDHVFGVGGFDGLRLHMVLPGVVANVSGFGVFVQIADGLVGLIGMPELVGAAAPSQRADGSADAAAPDAAGSLAAIPPARDAASALGSYRVAQPLAVRVISLRSAVGHSGGQPLVGLTLHTSRLNPHLDSPSQLAAGASMDVSDHPKDGGEPEYWARVLLVSEHRATVSLELSQPCELPRDLAFAHHSLDAAAASPPLQELLSVGHLVRVRLAQSQPPDAPRAMADSRPQRIRLSARLSTEIPPPPASDPAGRLGAAGEKRSWESSSEAESDDDEGEEGEGEEVSLSAEEVPAGKRRRVTDTFLVCGL